MTPHLMHTELMVVTIGATVVHAWALVNAKTKHEKVTFWCVGGYIYLVKALVLTFAGIGALEPHVTSVSVADTSTIFIPSTAWSAATGSA